MKRDITRSPSVPSARLRCIGLLLAATLACNPAPTANPLDTADNQQVLERGSGKDNWWDNLPRPVWNQYERIETAHPWFEVYRIQPNVLAIYEPGQFEEVISYLIVGSRRAVLFDTGLGIGDIAALVDDLLETRGRPAVLVVNSHSHYDHVGANDDFDNILAPDSAYTHKHAQGRAHSDVAEFVGPGWIWKDTPAAFSIEAYASPPYQVTRTLEDGEILDLGGVELTVLLTPGHAPDALCLLDHARRLLFTGDTFYPATLYAHLPGSDFAAYRDTASRLADLAPDVDHVLPSHNEPFMASADLEAFGSAFRKIERGDLQYVSTDGQREYDFGRFSILVADPPPWEIATDGENR